MKNLKQTPFIDQKIEKKAQKLKGVISNQSPSSITKLLAEFSNQQDYSRMRRFSSSSMSSDQFESNLSNNWSDAFKENEPVENGLLKFNKFPEVARSVKKCFKRKRLERAMTYPMTDSVRKCVSLDLHKPNPEPVFGMCSSEFSGIVPPGQRRAKILSLMGLSPETANLYPIPEPIMFDAFSSPNLMTVPVPQTSFLTAPQHESVPVPFKTTNFQKNDRGFTINGCDSNWKSNSACLSPNSPLISDSQLVNVLNSSNFNFDFYSNTKNTQPEALTTVCGNKDDAALLRTSLEPNTVQALALFENFISGSNFGKYSDSNHERFPLCESINSSSEPSCLANLNYSEIEHYLEDNQVQKLTEPNSQVMSCQCRAELPTDSPLFERKRPDSDGTLFSVIQSCGIVANNNDSSLNCSDSLSESCLDNFSQNLVNLNEVRARSESKSDHLLSVEEFMDQLEELTELTLP